MEAGAQRRSQVINRLGGISISSSRSSERGLLLWAPELGSLGLIPVPVRSRETGWECEDRVMQVTHTDTQG